MTLTPEQKKSVSEWVAAGDNLYTIQKKLVEHLKVSMTYMDVRFLVDDLNLELKDPAPKADASDVSKATPAKAHAAGPGLSGGAPEVPGQGAGDDDPLGDDSAPAGAVAVAVDKVSLHPGAMASGTVR